MPTGEWVTRWTIRVALLLCAMAALYALRARQRGWQNPRVETLQSAARICWTLAWLVYLTHVAAAFQFYHHWSQQAAWEHTAARTKQVLGIDWGGGLWFNYLFTVLWGAEVAWLWLRSAKSASRPKWLLIAWYGWFATMVCFATVVFETGPTRWISATVLLGLGAWLLSQKS